MTPTTIAKKTIAKTVTMTPTNLAQVEDLLQKKLLWKLGAAGQAACRRIVRDAIDDLPNRFPYPSQVMAYRMQKGKLERLLERLGK